MKTASTARKTRIPRLAGWALVPFLLLIFFVEPHAPAAARSTIEAAPTPSDTLDVGTIYGKIQFVEHFPDYKVKIVDHFPDLKVQVVEHFPDGPGKWQIVEHFPDYKIQIVDNFPDFTIEYVDHFPGVR